MKRFLLISILICAINLLAEMSMPASFWPNTINISEQNSIIKQGDANYLVFSDRETSEIIFGKGENFDYQFVQIGENILDDYPPTLCLLGLSTIMIAYNRNISGNGLETVLAKSDDGGVTFDFSVLDEVILNPVISSVGDNIRISGYTGSTTESSFYGYFTDTEESENYYESPEAAIVKFGGSDIIHTPVHSNTDIWIEQWDEGYNGGWPLFFRPVTTSGIVRLYPDGAHLEDVAPIEDIFRGGYTENYTNIDLIDNISDLDENSIHLANEADVLYIELEGDSYTGYAGIWESRVEEFEVYSWYPASEGWVNFARDNDVNWFLESENIYTNFVTLYDIVWTELSGDIPDDSAFFTEADLWIKGHIEGKQVWGSAGNVRILGDIFYLNSSISGYPDGFSGYSENQEPEFNGSLNNTDFFSLSAGKKINIGYKYRHPATDEVISVSTGENDFLYLHGFYSAVGVGDEDLYGEYASHYDGSFSFEYQHPHGSTPDFVGESPYTFNDTTYSYIDLHKYIFPNDNMVLPELYNFNLISGGQVYPTQDIRSTGYPNYSSDYLNSLPNVGPDYQYPYLTDYPGYNPVWPEPINDAMFERGELKLNGSIVQRRRGFIHRSGHDDYNHSDSNNWDLENYQYGANHSSTGYEKRYYHDTRLQNMDFVGSPTVYNYQRDPKIVVWESSNQGESFNLINEHLLEGLALNSLAELEIISQDESIVFIQNKPLETIFWGSADGGLNFNELTIPGSDLTPHINNGVVYVKVLSFLNGYALTDMEQVYCENMTSSLFYDVTSLGNNLAAVHYNYQIGGLVYSFTLDGGSEFEGHYENYFNFIPDGSWDINIFGLNDTELVTLINHDDCKISYGTLDGIVVQEPDDILPIKPSIANYPNPFNPSTEINFSLASEDAKDGRIEIYNIKGQKVKQYADIGDQTSVIWDGKDKLGNSVASGIYFATLITGNKVLASRKLMLLK